MSSETECAMERAAVILLVEDNPADAELAKIGLKAGRLANEIHSVGDGEAAVSFLRRDGVHTDAPRPDLILLDLNLPGMDGREVLAYIKNDPELQDIPVVVLTTSDATPDIEAAYRGHANSYLVKPVNYSQFHSMVVDLTDYWFRLVRLPSE